MLCTTFGCISVTYVVCLTDFSDFLALNDEKKRDNFVLFDVFVSYLTYLGFISLFSITRFCCLYLDDLIFWIILETFEGGEYSLEVCTIYLTNHSSPHSTTTSSTILHDRILLIGRHKYPFRIISSTYQFTHPSALIFATLITLFVVNIVYTMVNKTSIRYINP